MKIIERIFEYIKYKGVTIADFERQNSLSNGYLRKMKQRNADIGETIIVNLIENCPDISLRWFILGEGAMLKEDQPSEEIEIPLQKPSNDLVTPLLDRIDTLTRENERLKIENAHLESELERMRSSATDAHSEPSARAV